MLLRHQASSSAAARRLAASVLLGVAAACLLWAASGGKAGPWPLLLAVPPFFVARAWGGAFIRRTPFDFPLFLFLATALLGVWAAYDRTLAQDKLWLLVGALLLFYALALQEKRKLWPASAALALLGLSVAAHFLLAHDWQAYPVKFTIVNRVAQWWAAVRPAPGSGDLHPNVAGSLMAMLLPFQLIWAIRSRRAKRWALFAFLAAALALTTLALLLTASRGAVLAGGAGLAVALLWFVAVSRIPRAKALLPLLWGALVLVPLLLTLTMAFGGDFAALDRLPGPAQASHRAQLAGETRRLIADFPFTGAGLAAFPGLYSQYILRIPFYFLPNGHNLFLDVALEQGIVGIAAFLAIVAVSLWLLICKAPGDNEAEGLPAHSPLLLQAAAIASFVTLLFHGLVEDTMYGSSALPLLFVVPAFAVALGSPPAAREASQPGRRFPVHVAIGGLVALMPLVALLVPAPRAALHANLGALQMARIELANWPSGEWADGSTAPLMDAPKSQFQQALLLNPRQATARYRLGALAMLRRDYATAVSHLEIAYSQDPGHPGIHKALGYSHLWAGAESHGTALLSTVEGSRQELQVYSGWWQRQGRPDLALLASRALEQLQQPR